MLLPDPEHVQLVSLAAASDAGSLTLVLTSTQTAATCPLCGTSTARIHSRYTRTVLDLPWAGLLVQLRLSVHKFFCDLPECPRSIFTERLPQLLAPHARRTHRLAAAQQQIGLALGGAAGQRLAAEIALPAGTDTLLDAVRHAPIPTSPPATIVAQFVKTADLAGISATCSFPDCETLDTRDDCRSRPDVRCRHAGRTTPGQGHAGAA
jgi:transposase